MSKLNTGPFNKEDMKTIREAVRQRRRQELNPEIYGEANSEEELCMDLSTSLGRKANTVKMKMKSVKTDDLVAHSSLPVTNQCEGASSSTFDGNEMTEVTAPTEVAAPTEVNKDWQEECRKLSEQLAQQIVNAQEARAREKNYDDQIEKLVEKNSELEEAKIASDKRLEETMAEKCLLELENNLRVRANCDILEQKKRLQEEQDQLRNSLEKSRAQCKKLEEELKLAHVTLNEYRERDRMRDAGTDDGAVQSSTSPSPPTSSSAMELGVVCAQETRKGGGSPISRDNDTALREYAAVQQAITHLKSPLHPSNVPQNGTKKFQRIILVKECNTPRFDLANGFMDSIFEQLDEGGTLVYLCLRMGKNPESVSHPPKKFVDPVIARRGKVKTINLSTDPTNRGLFLEGALTQKGLKELEQIL